MRRRSISDKSQDLDPTLTQVLTDFGGPSALKIADVLIQTKEEITDENLAESSGVKLNIVRKILYILNENKLTEFRRVRDKRSGWFIYLWKASFENLNLLLQERREEVVGRLETRMRFEEENVFFLCNKGCKDRYVYIDAMDKEFKCPKCEGGVLVEDRNKEKVQFLKESIVRLRNL